MHSPRAFILSHFENGRNGAATSYDTLQLDWLKDSFMAGDWLRIESLGLVRGDYDPELSNVESFALRSLTQATRLWLHCLLSPRRRRFVPGV
jgi:hypothetical protein